MGGHATLRHVSSTVSGKGHQGTPFFMTSYCVHRSCDDSKSFIVKNITLKKINCFKIVFLFLNQEHT